MEANSNEAPSKALKLLLEMKSELVWFVRRSTDRVLRMDFGRPHLKVREPNLHKPENSQAVIDALERRLVVPAGQWHLFVAEGGWSVNTTFYACGRYDANIENIDATLAQLDGQRLVNVSQSDGPSWILEFDLGGSLHLSPPKPLGEGPVDDKVLWTLFYENANYVSYTMGGHLTRKGQ